MEHDLDVHLKCIKVTFSNKQIGEIKKKLHIDPIFTYWDSEIALKVCGNKQRIKFNCRPLCYPKEEQSAGTVDWPFMLYTLNVM